MSMTPTNSASEPTIDIQTIKTLAQKHGPGFVAGAIVGGGFVLHYTQKRYFPTNKTTLHLTKKAVDILSQGQSVVLPTELGHFVLIHVFDS